MRRQKKQNGRKIVCIILIVLLVLACVFAVYVVKYNKYNKEGIKSIFSKVEDTNANLTEYIVYGTHLNLKGSVNCDTSSVNGVNLVLAKIDGARDKIELKYEINNNEITFSTSDFINEGIDLEGFTKNRYYLLIEVQNNKKYKYYSIENKTEYGNITYYTITKDNINYKEEIGFSTYETEDKTINYMAIDVKNTRLPKNVYDVVVDPGHGGSDNGAEYGRIF